MNVEEQQLLRVVECRAIKTKDRMYLHVVVYSEHGEIDGRK